MYESWGNPELPEFITMSREDREEEKEIIANLKVEAQQQRENCEDLIKMIELVEQGKRKTQCLYDLKDYIKKDLVTTKQTKSK